MDIRLSICCVIFQLKFFLPRLVVNLFDFQTFSKQNFSINFPTFVSISWDRLFSVCFQFYFSGEKRKFLHWLRSSQMFWWSLWLCQRECGWGNFPFEWKRKTFSCFFSLVSCPEVFRSSFDCKIRPRDEDNCSSSINGYGASRRKERKPIHNSLAHEIDEIPEEVSGAFKSVNRTEQTQETQWAKSIRSDLMQQRSKRFGRK